ncbi:NACHT domain-containing protein [Nostoc sp. FACHB-87]|uniref:NACHT domain-containing protein n=1 Tax=Nostocaceae TaxID=1162 RepID=UPI001682BD89|nr:MULTISPECIES: NACHT domain-containing protein [Nostocaceae]MBD2458649.1 NACHT domain-containing protein [Nostoc sp. FACHB-87]MBD2479645.1 NACHT domain-containing protein [Anabaena sp. FACHB-83]
MRLEPQHLEKIDDLLKQELEEARGDEELLVIIRLEGKYSQSENNFVSNLKPSDFPNRQAYRQALIDLQKQQVKNAVGETIKKLESLGLTITGGEMSETVIARGEARQILSSLELAAVRRASLDRAIAINDAGKYLATILSQVIDTSNPQVPPRILKSASQYYQNYYKRYGKLRVLGMKQFVPLDYIYTAVQFLSNWEIANSLSLRDLEAAFRKAYRGVVSSEKTERKEGIAVANQNQYLMVLGAPGSGKSTFLRKMGLEAFKGKQGKFGYECIPVLIELKRFKVDEINIAQLVYQEFNCCDFVASEILTKKLLETGKLLILFDGLDEVPTKNLNTAVAQIQAFVNQYQKNRFIVSCRTAAYHQQFRQFENVEIAEFTDEQIEQFINNWFQSEEDIKADTARQCWELLQKNESAKELARTPLLLTFICLYYDEYQSFTNNRSELYKKALDILLDKWLAEKRVKRDPLFKDFTIAIEESMLAEIAYRGFEKNRLFFTRDELIEQIQANLTKNENAPKTLNSKAVLKAIQVEQGILVERVRDAYAFSHLTLQEYLTAKYICDWQLFDELVNRHLIDTTWKEVFLLTSGLLRPNADKLLLQMEKTAQKYINTPKLKALLKWAERETSNSPGDIKPVGKRAIAYVNAIAIASAIINVNAYVFLMEHPNYFANIYANTFDIVISNTYDYDYAYAIDRAIKATRNLERLQIFNNLNFANLIKQLQALKTAIPDDNQFRFVKLRFANKLLQTLLKAFNLNLKMVSLSEEELKAWDNYLYANYLILQCKQAAVIVSPQTWAEIEDRMLRFY